METYSNVIEFQRWNEAPSAYMPCPDTHIVTSDGRKILAHSSVLASSSPVLEDLVYRPKKNWRSERVVWILGVPSDAVIVFLQFLYSSSRTSLSWKEGKEAIEKHGIHLIALSHKYRIEWLKKGCETFLAQKLSSESVIDVIKIAKLFNSPCLREKSLRLIYKDFPSIQQSEAWRFLQKHDPRLEAEILQYIQDVDQRKKRWWRERAAQEMYLQLSEAMDSLQHICTEGCTKVRPHDKDPPRKDRGPCTGFRTCEGLQLLISHFASCSKRLSPEGACPHCKRMWQLFRLHSFVCHVGRFCKVPLCRQFKMKPQKEGKGDDATWRLLAKKVMTARAMASLSKRKRLEPIKKSLARCSRGNK